MTTQEMNSDLINIEYFWFEMRDLERWSGFEKEEIKEKYPAIVKAWKDYMASRLILDAVIRDAGRAG